MLTTTTDALTSTPNETFTYTAVSMISDGPSWTFSTVLNIVVLVVAAGMVGSGRRAVACAGPARSVGTPAGRLMVSCDS